MSKKLYDKWLEEHPKATDEEKATVQNLYGVNESKDEKKK